MANEIFIFIKIGQSLEWDFQCQLPWFALQNLKMLNRYRPQVVRCCCSPNILTARLRRLEADGILTAVRYQDRPARFRYELTEIGQQLGDALDVLASWGARHAGAERTQDAAFHPPCGTALESRPWCPTCERIPAQDEVIWL